MLPLPAFRLHRPRTLRDAVELLGILGDEARIMAGGTDLLPKMKNGVVGPRHVVSIADLEELRGVAIEGERFRIGAGTSLETVGEHPAIREEARALAEAALAVGGPHHRRMGTIGGNVCLDTRCRYVDQSAFWRGALGHCLKKDGDVCHVVPNGRKCVAAASNDTAAALVALDAEVALVGPRGERTVGIDAFFVADGTASTAREPAEIVVEIRVPRVRGRRSAYEKLRRRNAIDFPLLSVAARLDVIEGTVEGASLVVSALASRPRNVAAGARLRGASTTAIDLETIAAAAQRECRPLPNVDGDPEWRRQMVPVLVRRALERIVW